MAKRKTKIAPWREKIYHVIFEAETPAGKAFDVALLWSIIISITAVALESVPHIGAKHGPLLITVEWFFTILFTIEFFLRLISVHSKRKYLFSFFGMIDLLAIIPTYLGLYFAGAQTLLVVRAIRLLRVFRIFKLGRYLKEARVLSVALRSSRPKIIVFLVTVLSVVLIMGSAMYLIEGSSNGFSSIPKSAYWAIVTMTTVGYGDIVPQTTLGQFLASLIMICGYGVIAVPTGIVSVELANATKLNINTKTCKQCTKDGHAIDSVFCRFCGYKL